MSQYCRVAIDSPVLALDRPFDYRIPERMAGRVRPGCVVRVRLAGRNVRGFVTALLDEPAVARVSPLSMLVSETPIVDEATIDLARWTARRYVTGLGAVLHNATPGKFSLPAAGAPSRIAALPRPSWLEPEFDVAVSRRSAVCLAAGSLEREADAAAYAASTCVGGALVLAGRQSTAEAIAARVPGSVLIHSGMSPAKRAAAWASGSRVVVGGRAALFAPVPDLALVAVVGATDYPLKSDQSPRLHATVVARERARRAGAAFLVTSPPLDWMGPAAKQFTWFDIAAKRKVELASVRGGPVTPRLVDALSEADGEVLVFVARRGLALRVHCQDCGWYPRCPSCTTPMSVPGDGTLRCRGCGHTQRPPNRCPECRGSNLDTSGWGLQRVAKAIQTKTARSVTTVDADTPLPAKRPRSGVIVATKGILGQLREGSMAAVLVADGDQLLSVPDFRAAEEAFTTLRELASLGGGVGIQTREPDHHVFQGLVRGTLRWFAQRELATRKPAGYPPYGEVVSVSSTADTAWALQREFEDVAGPLVRPDGQAFSLLRAPSIDPLLDRLRTFALAHPDTRIDVDPVDVA